MGPLSYMRSVVNRKVVMRRMSVNLFPASEAQFRGHVSNIQLKTWLPQDYITRKKNSVPT